MHRHRRFWDQPTAFLPGRFAGKTAPWTQTPAFIPFGAGPRICIGLWFALLEAEMVMAQLLSYYAISLPGARPVLPVGRVTIERLMNPYFDRNLSEQARMRRAARSFRCPRFPQAVQQEPFRA
jgi:cytochrome P450